MQSYHQYGTSVFVEVPKDNDQPAPLPSYPGLKAALEDICDRLGDYYADFAAYDAREQKIILYPIEFELPKVKFVGDGIALFNLIVARSVWIDPRYYSRRSTETTLNDSSRDNTSDETEASDNSGTLTEDTYVKDEGAAHNAET